MSRLTNLRFGFTLVAVQSDYTNDRSFSNAVSNAEWTFLADGSRAGSSS